MIASRSLVLPEKQLYWWSVHIDRFLWFCRKTGPESSENLRSAIDSFIGGLPAKSEREKYVREQARIALDVFSTSVEHWRWGKDRSEHEGPVFWLKTSCEPFPGQQ